MLKQKNTSLRHAFLLLSLCALMAGCTFYKYGERNRNFVWKLDNKGPYNPRFYHYVVHYQGGIRLLRNVSVNQEAKTITGLLSEFSGLSKEYYDKIQPSGMKRRKMGFDHLDALEQVHIYANLKEPVDPNSFVEIPFSDISKIEVSKNAAAASFFITFGIVVVVAAVALTTLLIIACNCPHVYINNPESETVHTTLFTGAVSAKLERHDYKLMPDYFNESADFKIRIANDEDENQYTNLLELMTVYHDEGVAVFPDRAGNIHSVTKPIAPLVAVDNNLNSIREEVSRVDEKSHYFNAEGADELSCINLTFEKPANATTAKLVLRAKNTKWSGLVYKEFVSNFGSSYQKWRKLNQRKSENTKIKWMNEQGINLQVEIKTAGGWKTVDYMNLVGDIEYNTMVVPLSFSANDAPVEVRIRSGFLFWELDYAAMDFSEDPDLSIQRLKPIMATGNTGLSYISQLSKDDDQYMVHTDSVNSTQIQFEPIKKMPGKSRTLILHSKGYYTDNKNYSGRPNLKELRRHSAPGGLSRLSKDLYSRSVEALTVAQ